MAQLLSAADAARLLGVVPATVRQMERDGRLPAQRTAGGMRLFRRDDVEQLAKTRALRDARRTSRPVDTAGAEGGEDV